MATQRAAATAAGRIVTAVTFSEGRQRLELAAELGLPLGTVTSVAAGLVRSGALVEVPAPAPAAPRRGRPAVHLVHPGPVRTLGVVTWSDGRLRGTVRTYGGRSVSEGSFPMAPAAAIGDTEELNAALELAAGAAFDGSSAVARPDRMVIGVPAPFQRGVGVPGPIATLPDDGSSRPMFAPWLRTDPAATLSARFGMPVSIENDANLSAIGETAVGVGRRFADSLYIKMGPRTIGAGVMLDGRLYRGAAGFAGELAHIHIDDDGALCACGSRGCLSRRLGQALIDAVQPTYDEPVNFATIRDLAAAGEPGPTRVLRDLGRTIGRPLADLCTFLNPSAIVLDASLGPAGSVIADGIREQIHTFAAPAAAAAVSVLLGECADADVWGAVHLARAEALRS